MQRPKKCALQEDHPKSVLWFYNHFRQWGTPDSYNGHFLPLRRLTSMMSPMFSLIGMLKTSKKRNFRETNENIWIERKRSAELGLVAEKAPRDKLQNQAIFNGNWGGALLHICPSWGSILEDPHCPWFPEERESPLVTSGRVAATKTLIREILSQLTAWRSEFNVD